MSALQDLGAGLAPDIAGWLACASLRILAVFVAASVLAAALRDDLRARATVWRVALVLFGVLAVLPTSLPGMHGPLGSDFTASGAAAPRPELEAAVAEPSAAVALTGLQVDPEPAATQATPIPWTAALTLLWAAGFAAQLLRLAAGSLRLARVVEKSVPLDGAAQEAWARDLHLLRARLGVPADVRLRTTAWAGAPALCSLWRPVVLLPLDAGAWDGGRRRAVLTHELVHHARGDAWIGLGARLLRAVFWFHPAVGLAVRANARLQELRCDREVLRSGVDAIEYARNLVDLARASRTSAALGFGHEASLEDRVRRILDRGPERRARAAGPGLALLVLASSASAWVLRTDGAPTTRAVTAPVAASEAVALPASVRNLDLRLTGSLVVRTTPGDVATLRLLGRRRTARPFAEELAIETAGSDCVVRDHASSPRPGATWELRLPGSTARDTTLACAVVGDLDAAVPLAGLSAHTSLGRIAYRSSQPFRGSIDLEVGNGAIAVELPRIDGRLAATCGRGQVSAQLPDAGSRGELHLAVGWGDVTLRLADPERARYAVECPIGEARIPASTAPEGAALRCTLRASYGDVVVSD